MKIRDMFQRGPHNKENPTLQDLVADNPPVAVPDDVDLQNVYVRLPGDDRHPWCPANPYMALPFKDVRALATIKDLPPEIRKQVLEALAWMQSS